MPRTIASYGIAGVIKEGKEEYIVNYTFEILNSFTPYGMLKEKLDLNHAMDIFLENISLQQGSGK